MKFEEVIPVLRSGGKVRRRGWGFGIFIYLNEDGSMVGSKGNPYYDADLISKPATDWEVFIDGEIYSPKEPRLLEE